MARVAVLCVITLLIGKMTTHPLLPNAVDIDDNTINDLEMYGNSGEHIFKLPKDLTNGMIIAIKGIMSVQETFVAVLKSISTEGESLCMVQYDSNIETIRVEYPKCNNPPCHDIQSEYTLNSGLNKYKETSFALTFTTRIDENKEGILDVVFEGNEHFGNGPSKIFTCPIKNLNDIGYIQLKQGVEQVNSILFNITSQNLTLL